MSTLSNERTILEYTMLFDQDTLASSFDHMQFITADTASYQSFTELDNLQASLGSLERSIAARKRELLDEIKQAEEATEAAAVTAENINSAVSTLPDAPPAPSIKAKSVSEQLGLSLTSDLSDLHAGLDTDYSLGGSSVVSHCVYCLIILFSKQTTSSLTTRTTRAARRRSSVGNTSIRASLCRPPISTAAPPTRI
jgi:hypothetical protein